MAAEKRILEGDRDLIKVLFICHGTSFLVKCLDFIGVRVCAYEFMPDLCQTNR